MGGNIFKDKGGMRVSRTRYFEHKQSICDKLDSIKSSGLINDYFIPPERSDKEDFGDVDILISALGADWIKIREILGEKEYVCTAGNIFSFLQDDLQIDLIFTQPENYEVYRNFITNGDASMVMGRIARLFDLKYGIYGLEFIIRDLETNHVIKEINISKDVKRIIEFLGYDYNRWIQGFDKEDELFEFVFSSRYIYQDILLVYSENTKHRKRDKNRDQYKRMYEWFMFRQNQYPSYSPFDCMSTEERIEYVDKEFPECNVAKLYAETQEYIKRIQDARSKFSGTHIRTLYPNATDKEFGKIMGTWLSRFKSKDEMTAYILATPIDELYKQASNLN